MSWRRGAALAAILCLLAPAGHAGDRWQALLGGAARLTWQAPGLDARAERAEGMQGQLGYRIERYLWKAQEPGGAFALAALRDFSESDHYISGKLDAARTAALLLKGLETPATTLLDAKDHVVPTGLGLGHARRFALGVRECLGIALYAGTGDAAADTKADAKAVPPSEGSMRLDALYCAKAGGKLLESELSALSKGLAVAPPDDKPALATTDDDKGRK